MNSKVKQSECSLLPSPSSAFSSNLFHPDVSSTTPLLSSSCTSAAAKSSEILYSILMKEPGVRGGMKNGWTGDVINDHQMMRSHSRNTATVVTDEDHVLLRRGSAGKAPSSQNFDDSDSWVSGEKVSNDFSGSRQQAEVFSCEKNNSYRVNGGHSQFENEQYRLHADRYAAKIDQRSIIASEAESNARRFRYSSDIEHHDDVMRNDHDDVMRNDQNPVICGDVSPIKVRRRCSASACATSSLAPQPDDESIAHTSGMHAEVILEQACSKLMRLSTAPGAAASGSPPSGAIRLAYRVPIAAALARKSLSHPGTPPSPPYPELRRKYSMGNQDIKRQWAHSAAMSAGSQAVDLTVKRFKLSNRDLFGPNDRAWSRPDQSLFKSNDQVSSKPSEQALFTPTDKASFESGYETSRTTFDQEASKESNADASILRSALRGRAATYTFGERELNASKRNALHKYVRPRVLHQRVALAKRALNPVKSRVLERLNAMVGFVLNLPEFNALPCADQRTLLAGSAHRLLLLFMAEANLEFAVTMVTFDEAVEPETGSVAAQPARAASVGAVAMETAANDVVVEEDGGLLGGRIRVERPTKQFVEGVQNFIAKCQAMAISPSEYFFMRWILLFHAGMGRLERPDLVSSLNTAARQDLQEIVAHSHPRDRLRSSRLLLALHTVCGVHCAMLEALFCAPLALRGTMGGGEGVRAYVCDLLRARQDRDCAMTLGDMDA